MFIPKQVLKNSIKKTNNRNYNLFSIRCFGATAPCHAIHLTLETLLLQLYSHGIRMPSRLIRRRRLSQRIKAYLNPLDFLLWLSEELNTSDWDQWQKAWATPVGIALNFVFLIARASYGPSKRRGDDVFGDDIQYTGWLSWLVRDFMSFSAF